MSAPTSLRGYAPEQGSAAWKVIEYLTTHPDEALSPIDIEAKYGKPRTQVHSILAKAISTGVLVREEDLTDGGLIYKIGKGHPDIKANPGGAPSLRTPPDETAKPLTPSPHATRHYIVLDVDALAIDDGIPLPPVQTGRRSTDWPALFARLKPGNSVRLPKKTGATLKKAITVHHAGHEGHELAVRAIDADHIRLWRVK